MGYDLVLCGTTLFSDNPWEPLARPEVQEMLGARVYYHTGTAVEYAEYSAAGGSPTRMIGPAIHLQASWEHFRQVFLREEPDLLLINYARWGRLAMADVFRTTPRIMRSLDVMTINEQMLGTFDALAFLPGRSSYRVRRDFARELLRR